MACARGSGGLGNDEMFRQAFADRFASLNSAFSSSPDSEVDFIAASGPACQSCQVLSRPQDMHRRGHAGARDARMAAGNSMMQWVVFFVLLVGIVAVLGYIIRKLCGVKAGAEKPLHGAAKTMPAAVPSKCRGRTTSCRPTTRSTSSSCTQNGATTART